MADAFTPVASGIIPPDPNQGMRSLSAILGIQQQRQDLATGQATQRSAQARATVDTQGANENQALARLLSDPVGNGIVDGEGNPTKNAQALVMRAAPTTGADAYDKVVKAAQSKIEFNGAVNSLKGSERKEIVDNITGSAASPDSSYQDMKDNLTGLVESKKGTPEYDSYKKIADISTQGIDHLNRKEKDSGQVIPWGKEAWRGGAANLGRTILGASGVVGTGGISMPQATSTGAGIVNRNPVTGELSAPPGAAPGSALNPSQPQVASATARATGTAGSDIDRSNEVAALQQQSSAAIPLTQRIDQLSHEINSGNLAKHISEGVKWLGFSSVNEARSQLNKDLGQVKSLAIARAGSDSRAATVLEGYPTDTTPESTVHAAMDYIRGTARQNLARGQLLSQYQKEDPQGLKGFQAADNILSRTTDPLMHEYSALKTPQDQAEFFKRNFSSRQEAAAFRDHINAAKKHTNVIGQ